MLSPLGSALFALYACLPSAHSTFGSIGPWFSCRSPLLETLFSSLPNHPGSVTNCRSCGFPAEDECTHGTLGRPFALLRYRFQSRLHDVPWESGHLEAFAVPSRSQ
ncbi:hypothetical protein DFH29DRAFT_420636 [Suillus ampliporus]|nr:hypothetical protein DFH29DRAFT_420636 [Suillus ampliporus]